MKKFLILTLIVNWAVSAESQVIRLEDFKLNGPVESFILKTKTYGSTTTQSTAEFFFDDSGYLIRSLETTNSNTKENIYNYDNKYGLITKITDHQNDHNDRLIVHQYNLDGSKKTSEYRGTSTAGNAIRISLYDADQYLISEERRDNSNRLISVFSRYRFNSYIEYKQTQYHSGRASYHTIARYTLEGQLVYEENKNLNNQQLNWTWDYVYDHNKILK